MPVGCIPNPVGCIPKPKVAGGGEHAMKQGWGTCMEQHPWNKGWGTCRWDASRIRPSAEAVRTVQLSIREQRLRSNVKQFQGGRVFKAHRLLYHSTLGRE
jgi:hypothetical protein